MDNATPADALPALTSFTQVVLPDGERATVVRQDGDDVHVVHPGAKTGRGPWIYHRSQVAVAS